MTIPNAVPPLPVDAGDRIYVLVAVRGSLQWIEAVDGMPGRVETGGPKVNTLWIVAPGNDRYLTPPRV